MSKLQDVRKAKCISQGTLAELTEMSLSAVTKLEQGQRNINKAELSTLLKLCLTLDCRLSDILDDPETLELLQKYEEQ